MRVLVKQPDMKGHFHQSDTHGSYSACRAFDGSGPATPGFHSIAPNPRSSLQSSQSDSGGKSRTSKVTRVFQCRLGILQVNVYSSDTRAHQSSQACIHGCSPHNRICEFLETLQVPTC